MNKTYIGTLPLYLICREIIHSGRRVSEVNLLLNKHHYWVESQPRGPEDQGSPCTGSQEGIVNPGMAQVVGDHPINHSINLHCNL